MNQMSSGVEGSGGAAACKLVAGADSKALRNSGVEVHCVFCELVIVGDAIICAGWLWWKVSFRCNLCQS